MTVTIEKSTAKGIIKIPPSKSYAHRMLIAAALTHEKIKVSNISLSDDIKATISCLEALGAEISFTENAADVYFPKCTENSKIVLNCRESGSTLRFLIPIALLLNREITFTGEKRLFERPLDIYESICKESGFTWIKNENLLTVKGRLKPQKYYISGNISSQFITGLMFALPLLEYDSEIIFTSEIESMSYIRITADVLKKFGIKSEISDKGIHIKGNQEYIFNESLSVPSDHSSAAFFGAFNFLGGDVRLSDIEENSLQGDSVWKEYFEKLKNGSPILSVKNCPDLAPVLTAVAAALNGATLTDTKRLKFKESDRAQAMKEELKKLGVKITVNENEIIIPNSVLKEPAEALYGHNDHRIVMSLAVLLTLLGGKISDAQAVNKSFPEFWDKFKECGIKFKKEDDK